jgi:hypothetical protein
MKKVLVVFWSMAFLALGSEASAFQDVYDVFVVDYHMDYGNGVCTVTIDRDHPITTSTVRCKRRTFSWRCLSDDYRYEWAKGSYKHHSPIDIRYSENVCHNTGNMFLLLVW